MIKRVRGCVCVRVCVYEWISTIAIDRSKQLAKLGLYNLLD